MAARILDSEGKADRPGAAFQLAELYARLSHEVWSELAAGGNIGALDGFDVRTASDGDTALTVIAEHKPLCVLTDIDMPGMSGFELVRRLRDLYESDIVLIAITGWGTKDDRVAKEFDAFDYTLRKPIDLAFLSKLLRKS